ncbi:sodium/potassium-transporting ATPase subunit alpha-like [Folsomia candida]|uniref:sodium/potassium-transporting ATPase subunit alpha-like n=1 Tax=Folsomia candida TaxID=158441 RepID=UPI001604A247|nr:sodium/potassium-transporting ATPase subunit alpha-like [Folsomia candida]
MAQNYVNRRRQSTIVIENQDRILIPERKISRVSFTGSDAPSRKTSTVSYKSNVDEKGTINPSFTSDEQSQDQISLREVHVGHSPDIRRKSVTYIKKELEIDYHAVELGTLCNRYNSHVQLGLTDAQAHKNRELYGKNILTPPKKTPLWITFLHTLVGGFQLLLWTAAILSFIAYVAQMVQIGDAPPDNLYLGIALSVLVLVLGLFTFYQEFSSGKVMDSFSRLVPTMATVTRDHKILLIPASELVVGDVVHIKLGDSIPADIRILECQGLKVDNSSLTGESEPQPRSPLCTDDNPMETQNLVEKSLIVFPFSLKGTGKGLVVAVGDGTFIGRIAGLTTGMNKIDTPMSREVAYFVKVISFVAIIFGISFFAISLTMGYQILDAAIFLVGIIVANVPEGLLVTFTVILALTAKRMAKKNCVVRQLHAVETLGSCSVICSDKTGTLTQNKMTMSHIWVNNQVLDVSLGENGTLPDLEDLAGFRDLSRAAALCSRATFLAGQEELSIPQRYIKLISIIILIILLF